MGTVPPKMAPIPKFGVTAAEVATALRRAFGNQPSRLFGFPIEPEFAGRIAKHYFNSMDDRTFLRSRMCPVKGAFLPLAHRIYPLMWQHEYARRFYLRPLEAKPNTQDGTTLMRAI